MHGFFTSEERISVSFSVRSQDLGRDAFRLVAFIRALSRSHIGFQLYFLWVSLRSRFCYSSAFHLALSLWRGIFFICCLLASALSWRPTLRRLACSQFRRRTFSLTDMEVDS